MTKREDVAATIVLVRHGETEGRSSERLHGATDVELSDIGREQMRRVALSIGGEVFDRVYTSPLRRSIESARIAVNGAGAPPVAVEGFREINFGDWEGLTLEEARERDPEGYLLYEDKGGDFEFPGGGDTRFGFRDRVARAVRENLASQSRRTLAVLHKGVIKVALWTLLDIELGDAMSRPIELGSLTRLENRGEGWTLVVSNLVDHLEEVRIPASK